MPAYDRQKHFHPGTKEVTFLLGDAEFTERATLRILRRIEDKHGPAMGLLGRMVRNEVTISDLLSILGLILRDRAGVPKGDALADAVEAVGLLETIGAVSAFLSFGLAADQPQDPKAAAGN